MNHLEVKPIVPIVSVLMPVYNGMPYLPLAVESILNQKFENFELIIVNDCSTDNSTEYLNSLQDNRIIRIDNEFNSGICYSLQRGLETATGKYVARLDSDDVAYPERFNIQVKFLENDLSYGLIGSSCRIINENGEPIPSKIEGFDDIAIRWRMLFKNTFVHSTVMFRNSLIKDHNLKYEKLHGEDYDLWNKLLANTKGFILSEPLIDYRVHNNSWTSTKRAQQEEAALINSTQQLAKYLKNDSRVDLIEFIRWVRGYRTINKRDEYYFGDAFQKLIITFCRENGIKPKSKFWNEMVQGFKKRISLFTRIKLFLKQMRQFG